MGIPAYLAGGQRVSDWPVQCWDEKPSRRARSVDLLGVTESPNTSCVAPCLDSPFWAWSCLRHSWAPCPGLLSCSPCVRTLQFLGCSERPWAPSICFYFLWSSFPEFLAEMDEWACLISGYTRLGESLCLIASRLLVTQKCACSPPPLTQAVSLGWCRKAAE